MLPLGGGFGPLLGPHMQHSRGPSIMERLTSSLTEVSGMIQNAIDFAFPLTTLPLVHAVFT